MAENRYRDVKSRAKSNDVRGARLYLLGAVPHHCGEEGAVEASPFAIPCSPLLAFPGLGSAGWPGQCRGRGAPAPAPGAAVPGLGGQAAPAARGSGKMALPGSLPAFVAQFHPLSSPTGAILRSFLLPPRRVGRCRRARLGPWLCVLAGKRSCLGLWEALPEILKASLPSRSPQSFPSPWSPSWAAIKRAGLTGARTCCLKPATIPYNLIFSPLKYVFLVVQRIGIKKKDLKEHLLNDEQKIKHDIKKEIHL